MLIKDLYTTEFFNKTDDKITASITIDPMHSIFEGHFPGQPVLPGVCQMQIAKELVEKALERRIFLSESIQSKFLQMVDPTDSNVLDVAIDYNLCEQSVTAQAVIKAGGEVFFKMDAVFTLVVE